MKTITVIGAGNSGLATAGYLALNGYSVRLWNRSYSTVEKLIETKNIYIKGLFNKKVTLDIVTTDILEAIQNTELIMVTTPANSHNDIANTLRDNIDVEVPIILNPGRTFGALVFGNTLRKYNKRIPIIGETQTIIFTCRKISEDISKILAIKKDVLISTLRVDDISRLMEILPQQLIRYFKPTESMITTSIGNVGMILHCAPVLLNTGWIECETARFKYYYNGITRSIADLLQRLDDERVSTSRKMNFPIESLVSWLKRSYGVSGSNIYDCIHNVTSYASIDAPRSLNHRYIFEDIPTGLVPLEALGEKLGVTMEYTGLIIDLANKLLKTDFRTSGRNLKNLGLDTLNKSQLIDFFLCRE